MPSLSKWADKDESHQSGRELLIVEEVTPGIRLRCDVKIQWNEPR